MAEAGVDSLTALSHRKFWKADRGHQGSGQNRRGKDGQDVTIKVPTGTIIVDAEHDFVMKDLVNDGDSFIAAKGGKGGKGNARFKSSVNQVPREWTPGEDGEARKLNLELKVIADVGLVGKPNAGKSTLLSRVTKATPQIADYPFTTKFPNLGRVVLDWEWSFIMADIPGLIEGASEGVGLGHEFLRHIERAGILVHLVEPQPMDGTDPLDNFKAITAELSQYNEQLVQRPQLVAVTKAEIPGAEEVHAQLAALTGENIFLISAVTGQGLNDLSQAIHQALEKAK